MELFSCPIYDYCLLHFGKKKALIIMSSTFLPGNTINWLKPLTYKYFGFRWATWCLTSSRRSRHLFHTEFIAVPGQPQRASSPGSLSSLFLMTKGFRTASSFASVLPYPSYPRPSEHCPFLLPLLYFSLLCSLPKSYLFLKAFKN